jgi:hypothetical protein
VINEVADQLTTNTTTTFSRLHVTGQHLPRNIPRNYTVSLGDIAVLGLKVDTSQVQGGGVSALGAGIVVTLEQPEGAALTGDRISVAPVLAAVARADAPTTGHTTGGQSYASKVTVPSGTSTSVRSGATFLVTVPPAGTNGQTLIARSSGISLSPLGTLGSVQDTALGLNQASGASSTTTSDVANVNLFNGEITATALRSVAAASSSGAPTGSLSVVGLAVGGTTIPLNVAPNTVIDLAWGKVTVNQQVRNGSSIVVRALDIVLRTARNGLPAGAEVQIAVATASAA